MKRQALCLGILLTVLLATTACSPTLAPAPRLIGGGVRYTQPVGAENEFMAPCWATFAIQADAKGDVTGLYHWLTIPFPGVVGILEGEVLCVDFSETEAGPEAVFSVRITRLENWPDFGCSVNYAKIWIRDGGTPGTEGDLIGFYVGSPDQEGCGPGWTKDPGCATDAADLLLSFPVEAGNLMIR